MLRDSTKFCKFVKIHWKHRVLFFLYNFSALTIKVGRDHQTNLNNNCFSTLWYDGCTNKFDVKFSSSVMYFDQTFKMSKWPCSKGIQVFFYSKSPLWGAIIPTLTVKLLMDFEPLEMQQQQAFMVPITLCFTAYRYI